MFFLIFLITLVSAMSLFISIYSVVDSQYIYSVIYILISICSGYISYSLIESRAKEVKGLNQAVLFTSIAAIIFSVSALAVPLIPTNSSKPVDKKEVVDTSSESNTSPSVESKFSKSVKENFDIKEEVKMAAEMIGASDGHKWITEDSNIEIYKFDKNSDKFKVVKENKKIELEGLGEFPVLINGDYVMITSDNSKINEWFTNFK